LIRPSSIFINPQNYSVKLGSFSFAQIKETDFKPRGYLKSSSKYSDNEAFKLLIREL